MTAAGTLICFVAALVRPDPFWAGRAMTTASVALIHLAVPRTMVWPLGTWMFRVDAGDLPRGVRGVQGWPPTNPDGVTARSPALAFDTAVSFVTTTDGQACSGKSQVTPISPMPGLTVQNLLSAGTGMAVTEAVVRGVTGPKSVHLGNFRVEVIRSVLCVLLPLSGLFAL